MASGVSVSIVIAAFNAADSLERAVRSATAQTVRDLEVLIVDDGSTDSTASIAAALAADDNRIRLLGDGRNHGVSAARNIAFGAARGRWIAVLDADDAFEPWRLERMLSVATDDIDMIADDLAYWDWHACQVTGRAIGLTGKAERINVERFLANCITGRSPFDYGQLKIAIRRSFVERHRLRYIDGMRHGEDFMLYVQALLAGATLNRIDEAGYIYTQRVGAVSRTRSQVARTIENSDEMRQKTLDLLGHPVVVRNPCLQRLLQQRAGAIRWHASWELVYHPLRERRLIPVLIAALKDWRVMPLIVRESARWGARRVRGTRG